MKYLRERGVQGVYTKIHDEFGPAGVADFVKSAREIRAAGIRTYTTTYNFDRDAKSVAAIDPVLDLWQMAWPRQSPFELYREKGIPFERHNEVWGTTASSFWGNGDGGRAAGWMAARLGYQGVHTHGYMRWLWNDHEGCFPGADGPFNSVAVTNYAQGIAEGRYLAQLRRMIDFARRTGKAADVAEKIAREWESTVIGTDATCLLRLRHQPRMTGIDATWWPDVGTPAVVFEDAKRKVFELTVRLKQALGPVPRDVSFGDFMLVKAGKPVCRFEESPASKPLTAAVPELADRPKADAPLVMIGTLRDNPALRAFVELHLKDEITPHYPKAGRYAIRVIPASSAAPAALLVAGGDQEGTIIGVHNLVRLLKVDNQW